jgi:site-specific DNA-cytosine methylase
MVSNVKRQPLRYFSAFAGIGVTELAFNRVFPDSICVGYSEIDPYALAVYRKHFPKHKNYGDIRSLHANELPEFDVFVMGSPCTDLSSFQFSKLEWKGTRSVLFFDAVKILRHCKPKWFIMENVASMRKERCDDISKEIGVEPVMINSVVFGAGHRRRLYWVNFKIRPPKESDGAEFLKRWKLAVPMYVEDVLETDVAPLRTPLNLTFKGKPLRDHLPETVGKPYNISHHNHQYYLPRVDRKCNPVLTTQSLLNVVWDGRQLRYMTPTELERLQGLPDDYTKCGIFDENGNMVQKDIVKTRRHKLVGNSFHLTTFVYILESLRNTIL